MKIKEPAFLVLQVHGLHTRVSLWNNGQHRKTLRSFVALYTERNTYVMCVSGTKQQTHLLKKHTLFFLLCYETETSYRSDNGTTFKLCLLGYWNLWRNVSAHNRY